MKRVNIKTVSVIMNDLEITNPEERKRLKKIMAVPINKFKCRYYNLSIEDCKRKFNTLEDIETTTRL